MNAHFQRDDILEVSLPEDFVALVSAVSDIAFIVDRNGKILDFIWNLDVQENFDPGALIGVSMVDIVTHESRPKIQRMLKADGAAEGGIQREINHQIFGLDEFPVRYSIVGAGDAVIFLGQEIRAIAALQSRLVEAQRALDDDYTQLRQLETQYRVLFQTSSEALLVIDANNGKIEDCNGAAGQQLQMDISSVKGQRFETLFASEQVALVREAMHSVTATGQNDSFTARLTGVLTQVDCSLAIFRAATTTRILCTLAPIGGEAGDGTGIENLLIGMVSSIPDAMVMTDEHGSIRWCNDAFLGMSEIALTAQAESQPLSRFLGRPGVDIDIIISNARKHGPVRAFSSILTGAFGSETRVEISVASISEPESLIGFVMRDITRYDQIPARMPERGGETNADLMNLVGSVPLKELVRASTEEIEKMCIEAALQKTGNNRASAAEMLGLSRQSLYVKLRRFNLLDRNGN